MLTITTRFEFDSAHRLVDHEGKCRNLHGHRYAAEVSIATTGELDGLGRVLDFAEVKRIIGGWIDATLDHGCILNERDEDLIEFVRAQGWKLCVMDQNPTAEAMAGMMFRAFRDLLGLHDERLRVVALRLFETPNNWCDYQE